MSEVNQKIVIVMQKFSVVVKGIEKKLEELGYRITTLTDNFDEISYLAKDTSLFILYLPSDMYSDGVKMMELERICNQIKSGGRAMIVIGEKKDYDDYMGAIPMLRDYVWLDRPVDMDKLGNIVYKVIESGATVSEKKKILIVDDDPSYAKMVREWIKDTYQTNVVTAGMQAISFLLKNKVDLILLDYEMPVVDGPQVLQMLRQEPATSDIPVVFLTGVSTREEVARVMSLKPNGYILKSSGRDNILKSIASVI